MNVHDIGIVINSSSVSRFGFQQENYIGSVPSFIILGYILLLGTVGLYLECIRVMKKLSKLSVAAMQEPQGFK